MNCVVLTSIVLALLVSACAGPPGNRENRLSVATGGTGGVYYVYGGGIAAEITEDLDGYQATAEATSASVDNMILVANGSSDLGFTLADTAADAVEGAPPFEEPLPLRALGQLYSNYNHIVVRADSGIEDIEDLAGRTVSIGSPGSGTEITALRILEAAGVDPETEIEREQLSVSESAEALGDGAIDAFFWSGGLPTGAVTDIATTEDIRLLDASGVIDDMRSEYGDVYREEPIPEGTYSGVPEVAAIAVPNYLVVNENMDDTLAHDLTRLLFEQKEDLVNVHPEAEKLDTEEAQNVVPMELHPGAAGYYDETSE